MTEDMVNKPPHYRQHKSGVETITLAEQMPHTLATAFAYVERAPFKGTEIEDLRKARWYVNRFMGGTLGSVSDLAKFTRVEGEDSLSSKLAFLGFAMGDRSFGARYSVGPESAVGVLAQEILDMIDGRIMRLEREAGS